jgi:hypothetical protein
MGSDTQGTIPISMRLDPSNENLERKLEKLSYRIRVAMPGIIQSFDADKQTVTVKIAIREHLSFNGKAYEDREIPVLGDVPIYMPRAGNFVLTMPVTIGDECLVIFGDTCIDSWWETGALGNQMDNRRHDLSDGFAIIGPWSQPKVIGNYSIDSTRLRNLNNDTYVEVKDDEINIVAKTKVIVTSPEVDVIATTVSVIATGTVQVTGGTITLTSPAGVNLVGSNLSQIDGKNFIDHTHTGVTTGSGTSGEVS